MRNEGWFVVNPPPPETYHVYVIELAPDVAEIPRIQRSNPNSDPEKPCVYLGQTSTSPGFDWPNIGKVGTLLHGTSTSTR